MRADQAAEGVSPFGCRRQGVQWKYVRGGPSGMLQVCVGGVGSGGYVYIFCTHRSPRIKNVLDPLGMCHNQNKKYTSNALPSLHSAKSQVF
jgi:hypothetical protein